MNDVAAIFAVGLAGAVILVAERQQEADVVATTLQNRGVEISSKQARERMRRSRLYQRSEILLFFTLLALAGYLLAPLGLPKSLSTGATLSLIALGVTTCAMRAAALLRVIKDVSAESMYGGK